MKGKKGTYFLKHKISSIVMLCALAWLTISLPFVYADQQDKKIAALQEQTDVPVEDSNSNLLTNTTEEKTEGGVNTLSEYLHDVHAQEHATIIVKQYYKCHASDLYFAFHPELISPPPDA
jgi:hypothetical protein